MTFPEVCDLICYNGAKIAADLGISQPRIHHLRSRRKGKPCVGKRADRIATFRLLPILRERRYLLDQVISELEREHNVSPNVPS